MNISQRTPRVRPSSAIFDSLSRRPGAAMPNKRDKSWFYEASARFFSSLLWATIILVPASVVVYLAFPFL